MTSPGPLRFLPIFKHYLWGGRRLHDLLGKPCGPQNTAESWEVCDRHDDQSVVAEGTWRGCCLHELMQQFGPQIMGTDTWKKISQDTLPENLQGRFPLLFKVLDANQALSVQVHPNDRYASGMCPPDLGKTEAWYVFHADPGAKIYAGLKSGVDASELRTAIEGQRLEDVLHAFEPQVGDTVFIPAGTLHALGAGLMIAEIQQASNTTFRVYDWGRVDADGKSRMLHLDPAMEVIDFSAGPVHPVRSQVANLQHETLVESDFFVLSRIRFLTEISLAGDNQFHLLHLTQGQLELQSGDDNWSLKRGETMLIPANNPAVRITAMDGAVEFLEMHLPPV